MLLGETVLYLNRGSIGILLGEPVVSLFGVSLDSLGDLLIVTQEGYLVGSPL